ncbi:MAG: hypothetical protein QXY47_07615 [Thermoplasmata archaeon]
MFKNYQMFEKIDLSFLTGITGLKEEVVKQIFLVGDCFKVSGRKYKICQTTEEDGKKVFLCQVWQ